MYAMLILVIGEFISVIIDVYKHYQIILFSYWSSMTNYGTLQIVALVIGGILLLILWSNKLTQYIKQNIMAIPVVFLIAMTISLIAIGFSTKIGGIFAQFLGTMDHTNTSKKETIQFIALGMGGVVASIVAAAINRRASAQEQSNKLAKKNRIDERFNFAAQNSGSEYINTRIAAYYQFFYLAKSSHVESNKFKQSIFDILHSHLRIIARKNKHETKAKTLTSKIRITPQNEPKDKADSSENDKNQNLEEEQQTLLNILFKPDGITKSKECLVNLTGIHLANVDLQKADLSHAKLDGVNLSEANLLGANLSRAHLQSATLLNANLRRANLSRARLQHADLSEVFFWYTDLSEANLLGAHLSRARILRADFSGARIHRADFSEARILHADFSRAGIHRADFSNASFLGTNFQGAKFSNVDLKNVRSVEKTDFRNVKIGNRDITEDDLPPQHEKGEYYANWHLPPEETE